MFGRSALRAWAVALWLPVAAAIAASTQITEPFQGVRHYHQRLTVPRLVDLHIVEIDLSAPGIGFRVTPDNGDLPGQTTHQTTRDFLQEQGAQIAINANFFYYSPSAPYTNVIGLAVSDGDIYSPFDDWPAINISADNVATLVMRDPSDPSGHTAIPDVELFNAVAGNQLIVRNGQNVADWPELHPRTAMGITADQRLLLVTVDGRNSGHSLGMTTTEVADVMIRFGVVDAINLDGGGSTTLVFADPTPRVVNVPVGVGNVPGTERRNGNNLAVFALPSTSQAGSTYIFADFEIGDEGLFHLAPGYSGSTTGINASASTATAVEGEGFLSDWSQRLAISDDTSRNGGWLVRHNSGPGASPQENESRPAQGYIGFWAKTQTQGVEVAIAIDDADGQTADRSIRRALIADGQWHLYEWNLEDDSQWEGWVSGDGVISGPTFTLDSIHLFGPDADAVVWIDTIAHRTAGSLAALVPEPAGLTMLAAGAAGLLARRRGV